MNPSIVLAWIVTLIVSSLADIALFELKGMVPLWLLWIKLALPGTLILLSWRYKPLKSLRSFFIMLLAITSLTRMNTWFLATPAWIDWQNKQPFTAVALTAQLVEIAVSILLIILLFLLRKHPQMI